MFDIFGNEMATTGWVAEPNRRGTSSILSTCLVTTSSCIWTALHLNIPSTGELTLRWYGYPRFWRKVLWLGLGLIAPDLLVYTAWSQFQNAKRLQRLKIKSTKRVARDTRGWEQRAEYICWEMAHSYYAVMSGFVIDAPKEETILTGDR